MGSSVCSYLCSLILFGWQGKQDSVAGIMNPVLETSTVLGCAGLHPTKPLIVRLQLTICTVMVSPPKPHLSSILHSLRVEGPVCAVSRSGSKVHHGLFFTEVEACLHHRPCLASQPTIQFPARLVWLGLHEISRPFVRPSRARARARSAQRAVHASNPQSRSLSTPQSSNL
jgi:hypothetical protein